METTQIAMVTIWQATGCVRLAPAHTRVWANDNLFIECNLVLTKFNKPKSQKDHIWRTTGSHNDWSSKEVGSGWIV